MVLAVLVLIAAFVVTRLLMLRAKASSVTANVVGGVVVLAFIVGSLARPFGFPGSDAGAPAAAPVAQSATMGPVASYPLPKDVSADCHAGAKMKPPFIGVVDTIADPASPAKAAVNGGTIDRKETYVADGWALDVDGNRPAEAACLVVDGKIVPKARSIYGAVRPDVAASFSNQSLAPTGFSVTIPSGLLTVGKHTIMIAIVSHDGSVARARNFWNVSVR